MLLHRRIHSHECSRGHSYIASELDKAIEYVEESNEGVPYDVEQTYDTLRFEFTLGAILLFLSSQTLIYSLYLSILGRNWWGTTYICLFYASNMILLGLYDLGFFHDLPHWLYNITQYVNSVISGALTASTFIWLAGLRNNLFAQLGALGLSVFLNWIDFDANFRNFLIINLVGIAFSYQTLQKHLVPTGLATLITSFVLSIIICPALSQTETWPRIRRYYWVVHSVTNALEIMASSLLLMSVSY